MWWRVVIKHVVKIVMMHVMTHVNSVVAWIKTKAMFWFVCHDEHDAIFTQQFIYLPAFHLGKWFEKHNFHLQQKFIKFSHKIYQIIL